MAASGLTLVTPLMQEALSRATSFAARQDSLACGLNKKLKNLVQLLFAIQAAAEGAEEMQESDPAIRLWLQKLNDAVYDTVDVLDECDYYLLDHNQNEAETRSQWKKVRTFFSPSNLDAFGTEMAKKFKMINASLSEIRNEVEVIELMIQFRKQNLATARPYYERVHLLDSSKIVGRQDDVSKIIDLLNERRSQRPISGISLVGMPGVGKTTVARLVYLKSEEEKLYDLVAWVCASEDFNRQRILGEMLEHFNIRSFRPDTIQVLLQDLDKELENKTFLLILDDVWEKDPNKWSDFASCLSEVVKTNGNSIVLTTHSEGVASMVEKQFPICRCDIHRLSDGECWQIIENAVITRALITSDMEAFKQEIAKQCGGLPLVATAIGGKLSSGIETDRWSAITENKEWNLECRNTILSVLKMNFFNRMPSTLKKCFSYCSIFPQGFEISKDDLIQLWMASGFLQQSNESPMTMEEVGNEYFNELVSNSSFQVVRRDTRGAIKSCKMHDVLHDLALFVSKGETFTWESGSNISSKIRNLRINCDGGGHPAIPSDVSQRLHTLFLEGKFSISMESDGKNLRSLKLVGAQTVLSVSLDRSKHMRYLEIAESEIEALPESFSKLYMLQTLKVMRSSCLEKLPDDTSKLVSLRHLYVDDKKLMPKGIRHLTSLQTLPLFFAGRDEGFMIEELGGLSQLGGKLEIRNLEFVVSKSEADKARLKEKTELYKLKFVWTGLNQIESISIHEEVLEGLQPHSNLKSLTIIDYIGKRFPSWMVNGINGSSSSFCLNNMVKLKLINCHECTRIPSLGLLPALKVLHIEGMENVKRMGHELQVDGVESIRLFPALKTLTVRYMERLEEWVEVVEDAAAGSQGVIVFPCLEKLLISGCHLLKTWSMGGFSSHHKLSELRIKWCSNLTVVPSLDGLSTLKELELEGCDGLTSLPILGLLPALKVLHIEGMENVKRMGHELQVDGVESIRLFPALKKLTMRDMARLEEWVEVVEDAAAGSQGVIVFPCLEKLLISGCHLLKTWSMGGFSSHHKLSELRIEWCSNLTVVPSLDGLSTLKKLELERCDGLTSLPIGLGSCISLQLLQIQSCQNLNSSPSINGLTSLEILELFDCGGLTCLPIGLDSCISLQQLNIIRCSNLISIPEDIGKLHSLSILTIGSCENLRSIPGEWLDSLTRLKRLGLGPFWSELEEFPGLTSIHQFHASLEELVLVGWDKLKSLPHQLRHLTALKQLELWVFDGLEALPEWLGDLSSLHRLVIGNCSNLTHLPSIEAMQRLSKLQYLGIGDCPKLKKRCAKKRGPEWSKISHIPNIRIQGKDMQREYEHFLGLSSHIPDLSSSGEWSEIDIRSGPPASGPSLEDRSQGDIRVRGKVGEIDIQSKSPVRVWGKVGEIDIRPRTHVEVRLLGRSIPWAS